MKKTLVLIIICIALIVTIEYIKSNHKSTNDSEKNSNSSYLSLYLEKTSGTGQYEKRKSTNFPSKGYTFNKEKSSCNNGGEISWDYENNRAIITAGASGGCNLYFDKVPLETLANYIKKLYSNQGENNLYYHANSLEGSAMDNSYRYYGNDPNNWICFGLDDEIKDYNANWCDDEHLYRIIGVFNDGIKLISSSSFPSYVYPIAYNESFQGRNGIYDVYLPMAYNRFETLWKEKIKSSPWKQVIIAPPVFEETDFDLNGYTAQKIYDIEKNTASLKESKLLVPTYSDFAYSGNRENWNNFYKINESWMFNTAGRDVALNLFLEYPTTIDGIYGIVTASTNGVIEDYNFQYPHSIIPTQAELFYTFIVDIVEPYGGGTGTKSDPYRIIEDNSITFKTNYKYSPDYSSAKALNGMTWIDYMNNNAFYARYISGFAFNGIDIDNEEFYRSEHLGGGCTDGCVKCLEGGSVQTRIVLKNSKNEIVKPSDYIEEGETYTAIQSCYN